MPRVDRSASASLPAIGAPSSDSVVATVRVGETTLSDVARRLRVDPDALLQANPHISDHTKLKAGQEILLAQVQSSQGSGQDSALVGGKPASASAGLSPAPLGDPVAKSAMQATLNAKTDGPTQVIRATARLDNSHLIAPLDTLQKAIADSMNTQKAAGDLIESVKSDLDSMSEMGETESLKMQMAMDRMSKMMQMLSNLLQKMSETSATIAQNIK